VARAGGTSGGTCHLRPGPDSLVAAIHLADRGTRGWHADCSDGAPVSSTDLHRAAVIVETLLPARTLVDGAHASLDATRAALGELVESWPASARAAFRAVVLLVTLVAPWLWLRRATSFGRLSRRDRTRLLRHLALSPHHLVRAGFKLLSSAASLRLGALELIDPEPSTMPSNVVAIHRARRRAPAPVELALPRVKSA
jgi:hypothetical protein